MCKNLRFLILPLIILLLTFCGQKDRAVPVTPGQENNHKVKVEEILQSDSYTYLFVSEGFEEYWIATTRSDFKEKDVLYYLEGLEMRNLDSKELGKTFEKIMFVDYLSNEPVDKVKMAHSGANMSKMPKSAQEIKIEPAENGISVSNLFSDPKKYSNQQVIIRGKVVKFNENIMDKNWIHVQDGSSFDGKFDLTITSKEKVTVGDTATFKGTIYLNKDFGSGYSYEVIMEDAALIK